MLWIYLPLQETSELTKKQQWYQQNQVSMQKDDEEDYVAYCTEAMFKIHILELRLQVNNRLRILELRLQVNNRLRIHQSQQ